ncbi:MAG: 1,4-dihydroxy-2-naphthoate octaprenyltransferase [Bacteroidales bacterium]|nr:1,4-dihydroxy-2-naphthoate octaprenyltransferase [Bacteroidales bacterium]
MTLSACVRSMRLRTLPLSLSGVALGICIAFSSVFAFDGRSDADGLSAIRAVHPAATVIFLLLTTVLLQILSNLSNELGDTLNGTDREDRQGMHYSLQDGGLTIPEMKRLIASVAAACCLSGLLMVYCSFGELWAWTPILLLLLGAAAIWAAMHYTLGKHPYGYRGLGDIFVFIFFGLVSVAGGYFVCAHSLPLLLLLPASAIGFFSVGVLNVNNIRDMRSDAATRVTVAIQLGEHRARIYQTVLIAAGWICMLIFMGLAPQGATILPFVESSSLLWPRCLFLLTLPLYALHLKGVWTRTDRALDPMLPLLVLSTFALSLLAGIGLVAAHA